MLARSLAVLTLLISLSANALDLAGRDLFIPLAGRTPGAAGTSWQTDLVISNHTVEYSLLKVNVEFHADGTRHAFEVEVPVESSVVVADFARTKLGRDVALGTIRLTVMPPDAQISAQAIVYNTGGSVPLGQTVQALPVASLTKRAVVSGLLAGGGDRSNVGVGNPHDEFVDVTLSAAHGLFPTRIRLAPRAYVQLDAATLRSSSMNDTRSVLVTSTLPVYAYGSVIRNGGDPQFVMPVASRTSAEQALQPACADPARLSFAVNAAPGWIVVYDFSADAERVTAELVARYGFTPHYVYTAALKGFAAELTPEQVAAIRCEPVVDFVEQNAWASTATRSNAEALSAR